MNYNKIIERGLELGISEIELYIQTNQGTTMKLFEGELESYLQREYFGMAIRGLYDGKMGYVYTEKLTNIDEILNQLINNAQTLTTTDLEIIYDGKKKYQHVDEQLADYDDYSNLDKIEILQKLEADIMKADERIKKVSYCQYQDNRSNTKIINSKGLNLERNFSYLYVFAGAVAVEDGENAVGYAGEAGYKLKELPYDEMIKEIVTDATGTLKAGAVLSGNYPIVLKHSVATSFLSAFQSIFSAESAKKKLTILKDRIGEKVFGNNITIYDDPFFEKAVIKVPFDDEGVPCYQKKIVEDGVFKTFLHNLATADYFKTTSTGNGFKASIASSVRVTPTNLYLKPGTFKLEELISSLESGIYVTDVAGLHAGLNPISGDFNVQATGYLVEKGQIGRPITLFVISGNFYDMMSNVEMIADDLKNNFLGVASPSLKIKRLKVSGK